MTPGINVDNLGTGGGTATVAGIKRIVASNASITSGSLTLTEAGEGITVNTAAGPTIRISGAQTGVKHLVASDNTFSSGTVSITGTGGGVTINTAASKIQVSVASQTSQPGVANLVASDATFSSGTVSVTGAGEGITVNTAASKIQISGAQTGVKHLVASDNTFSSGTVSITGSGGITVNTAASKIQISAPNPVSISATELNPTPVLSFLPATSDTASVSASFGVISMGTAFAHVQPVSLHGVHLSVDKIAVMYSATTSTTNAVGSIRFDVGLYTRNGSSLSSLATSSYTTSWTSNSTTNNDWLAYSGARRYDIPFASSLTPGEYWLAVQFQARSQHNGSMFGIPLYGFGGSVLPSGQSSTAAVQSSVNPFGRGGGSFALSTATAIAGSDIRGGVNRGFLPWALLYNSAQPW